MLVLNFDVKRYKNEFRDTAPRMLNTASERTGDLCAPPTLRDTTYMLILDRLGRLSDT
jgi:hypothetical protein